MTSYPRDMRDDMDKIATKLEHIESEQGTEHEVRYLIILKMIHKMILNSKLWLLMRRLMRCL